MTDAPFHNPTYEYGLWVLRPSVTKIIPRLFGLGFLLLLGIVAVANIVTFIGHLTLLWCRFSSLRVIAVADIAAFIGQLTLIWFGFSFLRIVTVGNVVPFVGKLSLLVKSICWSLYGQGQCCVNFDWGREAM